MCLRREVAVLHIGGAVAKDFIMAYPILTATTGIAGVALYGVDNAVFTFFHDAHMVSTTIQTAAFFIFPVEEDNVARARLVTVILPERTFLEPAYAICTTGKFRDDAALDIATFICTP